jgi:hypothetical protein
MEFEKESVEEWARHKAVELARHWQAVPLAELMEPRPVDRELTEIISQVIQ